MQSLPAFLVLLAACTWPALADPIGSSAPCIAYASRDRIIGHVVALQSPTTSQVCEWLGVPYAAAPMGNLRFAPPEPSTAQGDFAADVYGPDCPQSPARLFPYPGRTTQYDSIFTKFVSTTSTAHNQSEDCLTLNVWSPSQLGPAEDQKLPVLVWIHGGRHASGTSNTPFYNGVNLASAQDMVVVTFNFRMNIFGFPGAPDTTQNVGLLDHYAAVAWVRDNIASFGGDPNRITVAGQSSGAVSVSNWAYAHPQDPIVSGAISHSGSHFSFPTNTLEQAANNWFIVAQALGCGNSSTGATLACMRSPNITIAAILDAVRRVPALPGNSPARSSPPFQATQDNTTFFSTAEYISRAAAGNFAHIPYLQIHNSHESGLYRISALANGNVTLPEDAWKQFEAESFTCAVAAEAFYRSSGGGKAIKTYRALFMADWDNTRLYNSPSSGAYHGVDINMVTGNSEVVSGGIPPVEEQRALTRTMQAAWAAFAREPETGLQREMGWPVYNPASDSLIRVGKDSTASVEFVNPATYDRACSELNLDFWSEEITEAEG